MARISKGDVAKTLLTHHCITEGHLTLTGMIENGRGKQVVCSNWDPVSREIFGNIRSDFIKNGAIPT